VLWTAFEDPFLPEGELRNPAPSLFHLNVEASIAFEEYVGMKIGVPGLTRLFLQNKVVKYLAKAAPGLHELVLLGKVWFEKDRYDHVVVDMPSTGYALAMFQSTRNFSQLFGGGPLHHDAEAMLDTFKDPARTGQVILALPEEMPLREGVELRDHLLRLFPGNEPALLLNRRFPCPRDPETGTPDQWTSPIASSAVDYVRKRAALEDFNLRIWRQAEVEFGELPYLRPRIDRDTAPLISALEQELRRREYL
jgi:hypothetical protein